MKKKDNRGGLRNPPGGRPKSEQTRATVSVCLSPENLAFRKYLGRDWNDYINMLLDRERKNEKDDTY